jgi:hypothetical protein
MALNTTRRGFVATGAATTTFSHPDLRVDANVAKSDCGGIGQFAGYERAPKIIETN